MFWGCLIEHGNYDDHVTRRSTDQSGGFPSYNSPTWLLATELSWTSLALEDAAFSIKEQEMFKKHWCFKQQQSLNSDF